MVDSGLKTIPLRLWECQDNLKGDGHPYIAYKGILPFMEDQKVYLRKVHLE